MTQYRVLAGIDYPPSKRAEVGDLVSDLPSADIKSLIEIGAIEIVDGGKSKNEAPVVEQTTEDEEE